MWELFSLGKIPYPGMDSNEALFFKIRDGYRLEKPDYSTTEIYHIMLRCWYKKPDTRPSFSELEVELGNYLQDCVRDVSFKSE